MLVCHAVRPLLRLNTAKVACRTISAQPALFLVEKPALSQNDVGASPLTLTMCARPSTLGRQA